MSKITEHVGTSRAEAFSDGVFAVAITLLVFNVVLPESLQGSSVGEALFALGPKMVTYVASFTLVGIFWAAHHVMFRYIERVDRFFLWANIALLMFISAVPFAASVLGRYPTDVAAIAFYDVTLLLVSLCYAMVWFYARYGGKLLVPNIPRRILTIGSVVIAAAPVFYLCAFVLTFFKPLAGLIILIIIPIAYLLPSPIDRLFSFVSEEGR